MTSRRLVASLGSILIVGVFAALPATALAQQVCGVGSSSLGNGGFETPGVAAGDIGIFAEADIPPWHTTDVGGVLEIWGDGFQGVPSYEGVDFAEINANSAGTLYQDVVSTPGTTMTWTVAHHGRLGDDAMRVLIGDAGTADVGSDTGWDFISGDLVDGTAAWGVHSDDYVVPDGQTCTRFAFRAVSSTGGDNSFGNLVDAISFAIPAAPTPTPRATQRPTIPPTDASPVPATPTSDGSTVVLLGLLAATCLVSVVVGMRVRRQR